MFLKYFYLCFFIVTLVFLSACRNKNTSEIPVEGNKTDLIATAYNENLYFSELKPLLADSLTVADSTRLIDGYVQEWLRTRVLLHTVADKAQSSPEIDRLVEDYRNGLLLQKYKKEMAFAPVDTAINAAQIKLAYDSLQSVFASPYTMLEADFLAVSTAWRDMPQVQKLWSDTKNPQKLEEFANKNAEAYFVKKWLSFDELAAKMPNSALKESSLSANKSLTAKSKETNYFIRINAIQKKGEKMSLEVATPQVRAVILQKRKNAAWESVLQATYQKELQAGRISLRK